MLALLDVVQTVIVLLYLLLRDHLPVIRKVDTFGDQSISIHYPQPRLVQLFILCRHRSLLDDLMAQIGNPALVYLFPPLYLLVDGQQNLLGMIYSQLQVI